MSDSSSGLLNHFAMSKRFNRTFPAPRQSGTRVSIVKVPSTRPAVDPSVSVVVVTGAGRAFSAGYDIAAGEGSGRARVPSGPFLRAGYQSSMRNPNLMMHVMELTKPVIAAVNGHAIAGGGVSRPASIMSMSSEIELSLKV